MNPLLIGLTAYVGAQLLMGLYVSRRIRGEEDYVLAGRSLGLGLATFSIFATWFGSETCVGSAGEIYSEGLSGGARDPFGYSLCLVLMGAVLAGPLRKRSFATLGDLFAARYSRGVERLAVMLMVPTSVFWAAAQIRAFAQVISVSSDLPMATSTAVAAAVVILYTTTGGMMADVVTDLVQGVMLAVGLLVVLVLVVAELGGIGLAVQAVGESRLSIVPAKTSILSFLEAWTVPICGSVVAQELISRVLACKTPSIARRACFAATGMYLTIGMIPVFVGLVGARLAPGLEDPERLMLTVAGGYGGPILYVVFAGALVSAILSTIDSCLLAAAALTCENLVGSVRRGLDSRTKLRISRGGVIVFGVVAYVLALHSGGILDLVEDASSFGSSGVFVVVAFGLFTRFGGAGSAWAALITGTAIWLTARYAVDSSSPYVYSLAAALGAYVLAAVGVRWKPVQLPAVPQHPPA